MRTKSYVLSLESLGVVLGLESPAHGLEGDLFCFGDLINEVTKNKKQVDSSFKYPTLKPHSKLMIKIRSPTDVQKFRCVNTNSF